MTALCEEYLRVMGVDGGRLLAAKNTASLSRKFERRVLNHVWLCCSAGSMNGWVKRLF